MKSSRWLISCLGVLVLLVVAATLWVSRPTPNPVLVHPANLAAVPAPALQPAQPAPPPAGAAPSATVVAPAPIAPKVAPAPALEPAFAQFDRWAGQYLAAGPAGRSALLSEGQTLAQARYTRMVELIQHDPAQALALALPYRLRQAMPPEIAQTLEQPLSGRGRFQPILCSHAGPHTDHEPAYTVTLRGKIYRTYTYGDRTRHFPHSGVPLHGITAHDTNGLPILALSTSLLRTLDSAETADLAAVGKIPPSTRCALCNTVVDPAQALVADAGDTYLTFCRPSHLAKLDSAASKSMEQVWPTGLAQPKAGTPKVGPYSYDATQGIKKLLYIPVVFADDPIPPESQDTSQGIAANNNRYYKEGSYGIVDWLTTVTPILQLPQAKNCYGEGLGPAIGSSVLGDAITAARNAGYVDAYDMTYTVFPSVPEANFGGRSDGVLVGGGGALPHELGHNFGLGHANYLDYSGARPTPANLLGRPIYVDSQIGHGDLNAPYRPAKPWLEEYGDPFDVMGSGPGHFNAIFKNSMNWLDDHYIRTIYAPVERGTGLETLAETNRIYAFDTPMIYDGRLYAMRFRKDSGKEYWLTVRQGVADNPWFDHGLEIMWNGDVGSVLVDTTPETIPGKNDAPVVVGRTLNDPAANIFLTPIAEGGSGSNKWLDVVVHMGPQTNNNTPTISLQASEVEIPVGGTILFTATASDPDGDPLAYNWDFDDLTFGTNGPVMSKTFTVAGHYSVRCEASDMRGRVAAAHVVIKVGTPTTWTISGRVTDPDGYPVPHVRVHNGGTPPPYVPPPEEGAAPEPPPVDDSTYRYTYTDSDGAYTLTKLPPGDYNCDAFLFGYIMAQDFITPVALVDNHANNINFIATALPKVTLTHAQNAAEDGSQVGRFTLTRDRGLDRDLDVFFTASGTAVADEDYINWPTNTWTWPYMTNINNRWYTNIATVSAQVFTIPAGSASLDVDVTPLLNNGAGDGGRDVVVTLQLAPFELRTITYMTNVISTNEFAGTNVVITNTVWVTWTNAFNIPGWQLVPTPPDGASRWIQTYPTYILAGAEASVKIVDDDPPAQPAVSVMALDGTIQETRGDSATLLFMREGSPVTDELTIHYTVTSQDGNGVDFGSLSGVVTIPAGEPYVIVPVFGIDDLFIEGMEFIQITLNADPSYGIAGGFAFITIEDNDLPRVSTYAADSVASKTGGNTGRVTILRTGDLTEPLVVNYLVSGTAVSGRDFQPLSGSVTIPANVNSANVTITPIDNAVAGNRNVVIQLSDSPAYNIYSQNSATVALLDNLPVVTLTTPTATVTEGGAVGRFRINRTGSTAASLRVYYKVSGNAVEGEDFASMGTYKDIPAGAASVDLTVDATGSMNDGAREIGTVSGQEAVIVILQPGPDYNLGNGISGTVRFGDNEGDNDLPAVGFMLRDITVREDVGAVTLFIKCSSNPATNNPSRMPIYLSYRTLPGTALPATNYVYTSNLVTFVHFDGAAGRIVDEGSHTTVEGNIAMITIPILNDQVVKTNLYFDVRLDHWLHYLTNINYITNNGTPIAVSTNIVPAPTNAHLFAVSRRIRVNLTDAGVNVVTVQVDPQASEARESGLVPGRFLFTRTGPVSNALPITYSISGTAASGNDFVSLTTNGVLGSVTFPPGTNMVALPVVPIDDPVEEGDLPETVVLTLMSRPGYSGGGAATMPIIDDDGTVQFTARRYEFPENAGTVLIPVHRSGDTNRTVQVGFAIRPGTAQTPADYLAIIDGTLTFAPGEEVHEIPVTLVDDLLVEPAKNFLVLLTNATGGVPLGGQRLAEVVILNDDTAIEFPTNTFAVAENGTNALITISRVGIATNDVSATFTTWDGTATNELDYTNTLVVVHFAPGETNQTISIPITDDALLEGNETVLLTLTDPVNVPLGTQSNATLLILEDECTVTWSADVITAWEYAPYALLTLQRLGGAVNPVSVDFYTFDGTALNGDDYLGTNGTALFQGDRWLVDTNGSGALVFHPGQTNLTLYIPLLDDAIGEGNEDFGVALDNVQTLALAQPGSAQIGPVTDVFVTILDNELPGNVDYDFTNPSSIAPGANGPVYALALQPDGQVVVGGDFTTMDGTVYNRISRLQTIGVADPFFNPGFGANDTIHALAIAPDNMILAGGAFTRMDTANWSGIARLRANGDLDPTFNPGPGVSNGVVRALALQTNGMILLGGTFTAVGGLPRGYIARLAPSGAVDPGFSPVVTGPVGALAVQADGKILIGSLWTNTGTGARLSLIRVETNGVKDTSFNAPANLRGAVRALAVQPDGRILVGGAFANQEGTNYNHLVRLQEDGTIDPTFDTGAGLRLALKSSPSTPNSQLPASPKPVRLPDPAKIVGGQPTTIQQFPYQVALIGVPYNPANIWEAQFCGGSILNDRWILTAAHCVVGVAPSEVAVAVGVTDLGQPQAGVILGVDQIVIHPSYNAGTDQNDIALLHLAAPIDFEADYAAAPVGLVSPADAVAGMTAPGVMTTITGWGNTSGTGVNYPYVLQVGAAPITTVSSYAPGRITPDMMMAGYAQGGVDTCQGDSGGPLVVTNGQGHVLQAGITSWGIGCAQAGYPGVYARVSYFHDWILGFTGSGGNETNEQPAVLCGVNALALDPRGRIVIGGTFTNYDGAPRNYFARVRASGALDTLFNVGTGANAPVHAVAVQTNTAILIGGDFTVVNAVTRNHVARIHGNEQWDIPGVQFTTTVFRVDENAGPALITIERVGNTNNAFTVDFITSDGTAVDGVDYTGVFTSITFDPGVVSITVPIDVVYHPEVTGNLTVNLALLNAPLTVDMSGNTTALLVIVDAEKSVRFSQSTYAVPANATNALIEVLREGNLSGEVSVTFRTLPGTATAGLDYGVVSNLLVFADGQTNHIVPVPVFYRASDGLVRTVRLVLTNETACTLGNPSNAWLVIQDVTVGLGTVDPGFDPGVGATGAGNLVRALAMQPDGKILVGGAFTGFDGLPRNYITRLDVSGAQDIDFHVGTGPNGLVAALASRADNRAMLGGAFSTVNGYPMNRAARLNPDGSVETGFSYPNGINANINALALPADGRAFVAGGFTTPHRGLTRLRTDGGADPTFDPGTGADNVVRALALGLHDGVQKLYLGGAFDHVNGFVRPRVARLTLGGNVDDTFNPPAFHSGAIVYALTTDAAGRLLVAGSFTNIGGVPCGNIARFNTDGALDPTFDPGTGANGYIYSLAVQPDGKILLGGSFTSVNQTNRGRYARLHPNGSLDAGFAAGAGADSTVYALLLLPDNGVILGGDFTSVDGLPRSGVARVVGDPPPPLHVTMAPGAGTSLTAVSFNALPGADYALQSTTDFLTWTTVATTTAVGYTATLVDPNPAAPGARFYRVIRLP